MTSQEAPGREGSPPPRHIAGYTPFLQSVALAHKDDAFADGAVPDAYAVLSNLLTPSRVRRRPRKRFSRFPRGSS